MGTVINRDRVKGALSAYLKNAGDPGFADLEAFIDEMPGLGNRFELRWTAGQRGKPGLNADINSATEATREVADPDFEILGTNGTSALCTFYAEGGIKLATAGADGDQEILLPHLDTNQTAWTNVTWGTDKKTEWQAHIRTGSSIAASNFWAGLKLTNTSVTATDANQVFFRYEDDVNDGELQAIYSIAGTDTEYDTGIVVAANTDYHLKITIDSSRIARMYVNGALVTTSTALTDAIDLIPYIGIEGDGASGTKHIYVFSQRISREIG